MDPWIDFLEMMRFLWIFCGCGMALGASFVWLCLSSASAASSGIHELRGGTPRKQKQVRKNRVAFRHVKEIK